MDYLLHEGRLTLPAGFEDRTVNLFIPGSAMPAPFSLTVARDTTLPGEALSDYVDRQVGVIAAKLRNYKRQSTRDALLGRQSAVPGLQVDAHYQSDGKTIYQRQAAFLVATDWALVFSGTCKGPFDDHLNKLWADVLASFQPHQPLATTL